MKLMAKTFKFYSLPGLSLLALALVVTIFITTPQVGYAQPACGSPRACDEQDRREQEAAANKQQSEGLKSAFGAGNGDNKCGGAGGSRAINTRFDFGCNGSQNAITDFFLAITRFLSVGVGLILIIGTIIAGIQFTVSRGDPNKTAEAIKKLYSVGIALLAYIFLFAALNFLVPGGLF